MKWNLEKCKVTSFHLWWYAIANNGVIPKYTMNSTVQQEVTKIRSRSLLWSDTVDKHICEKGVYLGYN